MASIDLAQLYEITVDYSLKWKERIERGNYRHVDSRITTTNFGRTRRQNREEKFEAKLFIAEKGIGERDLDHLKQILAKEGFRPAKILEILAFGASFPDVQRRAPIVAAGSIYCMRNDFHPILMMYGGTPVLANWMIPELGMVPAYSYEPDDRRALVMANLHRGCDIGTLYLGVRKK